MPVAIPVENLSKKYLIGHQQKERYTALWDIVAGGNVPYHVNEVRVTAQGWSCYATLS